MVSLAPGAAIIWGLPNPRIGQATSPHQFHLTWLAIKGLAGDTETPMSERPDEELSASKPLDYETHVPVFLERFDADDHRAFFACWESEDAEGRTVRIYPGLDESRLSLRQLDLLQLVMLANHINALVSVFRVSPERVTEIARHWQREANGNLEGLLEAAPHPIHAAPGPTDADTSEYRKDDELE